MQEYLSFESDRADYVISLMNDPTVIGVLKRVILDSGSIRPTQKFSLS